MLSADQRVTRLLFDTPVVSNLSKHKKDLLPSKNFEDPDVPTVVHLGLVTSEKRADKSLVMNSKNSHLIHHNRRCHTFEGVPFRQNSRRSGISYKYR
jgi:hypothetical protein